MNKKEIERIGYLISEIRAQNVTYESIVAALLEICPKATDVAEDYRHISLFEGFFTEFIAYKLEKEFDTNYLIRVSTKQIVDERRRQLMSREYRDKAMDAFLTYCEAMQVDHHFITSKEYRDVFESTDWLNAVVETEEEYGWDLEWLK